MRRARLNAGRAAPARRERGAVLIFVLIVMIIMFLAGTSVMRSADTANVMAGNFSFQQGAMQASDRALTNALSTVVNRVAGGAGNTPVANQYLTVIDPTVDSRGMPASIDWSAVSCQDERGVLVADCAVDAGNYRVQYVIERMCSANPDFSDVADIRGKCGYNASTTAVAAASIGVHYRVLIRVRGPRGTESWFEAMISGPAST